jgi:hypothetical protein
MRKRNASDEILNALGSELKAVGFPKPGIVEGMFEGIRSGRVSKRATKLDPSGGLALGYVAMMVSKVKREIAQHPPKSEAELDEWLEQMKGLRYKLRPIVGSLLKTAHEIFPKKKRGPAPKLTESQKQAACSTIDTLRKSGNTIQHAIEVVARDYRVTGRTMRHIWQTKGLA